MMNVYIVKGHKYKKMIGYGNFKGIAFENSKEQMIKFTPHQHKPYNHVESQPRLSYITQIGIPQTHFDKGQLGHELKGFQGTRNIAQNPSIPKVETEAVGVNTHPQDHKHIQTLPLDLSTKYTNTEAPHHKKMQTTPLNLSTKYTNTQTTDFASTQTAPSLNFQSPNTCMLMR